MELNVNEEIKVIKRKEMYLKEREAKFICLQHLFKDFIMFWWRSIIERKRENIFVF
jgi:hypothetical protein